MAEAGRGRIINTYWRLRPRNGDLGCESVQVVNAPITSETMTVVQGGVVTTTTVITTMPTTTVSRTRIVTRIEPSSPSSETHQSMSA